MESPPLELSQNCVDNPVLWDEPAGAEILGSAVVPS